MNSVPNWHKALLASAMAFGVGYAAQPKNIILMISDGWGYNQILAADYYKYGNAKASSYRAFPVALPMSTYSAGGNGYAPATAQSDATYVKLKPTDSAASGTAIASGIKTYDAAINMDMDSIPVVNIAERAQTLGKAAGVVTSVEFSHATPAAMVAHNKSRNNYAEIANEMIYSSGVEVIIGAGHPEYTDDGIAATTKDFKYVGGETSWNDIKAGTAKNFEGKTWSFIESKADFESLANGTGTIPDQLIGVPQVRTTLQQARSGGASDDVVGEVAFNSNVPDLATLSKCALNVLNKNDKGFFLMVEGGAVDWAGHANQSARNIEEQMDFNTAVDSVVAWIGRNGGFESNLLIVTGDHETGYLTGADAVIDADPLVGKVTPVANNGQGNMPGMKWNSGDHTNQLVPFYAKGSGADILAATADNYDPMRGYHTDNAKVGQVLQTIYTEGKVPADRIDPSSSSATSGSSSSTNSSSSTKPSSSSSGNVKPSSSSGTTALNPATTLRMSSLQVQGKSVLVHIGQSGVARLVINNVDGTRQAVLMNGYANAGFYSFALPAVKGASALVLETTDGRRVLNISGTR